MTTADYVPLSTKDRTELMQKLTSALISYESLALCNPRVRAEVYSVYNEKMISNHSLSKMSRAFTTKVKGASPILSEKVEQCISQAWEAEIDTRVNDAIFWLECVQLSSRILMGDKIREVLSTDPAAVSLINQIELIEYRLYQSIVALATNIGDQRASTLAGNIISREDIVQEALMAAWTGVQAFQPRGYKKAIDASKAFTTYMHNWILGMLMNYSRENSRTVHIPRKRMDRWGPVNEAANKLGCGSYEDIALLATKILHDRKDKKLSRGEVYTEEEVKDLMIAFQDETSLNATEDDGEFITHLADSVPADYLDPEKQVDSDKVNEKLSELVSEYCHGDEYILMSLRYLGDSFLSMSEVVKRYNELTGKRTNKATISLVEKDLKDRLKQDPRAKDLFEVLH